MIKEKLGCKSIFPIAIQEVIMQVQHLVLINVIKLRLNILSPSDKSSLFFKLWDTGGMERVASITSSYYKYSEAAILVFALDNADSFHILSQHLLDIVTYAENAKIFL